MSDITIQPVPPGQAARIADRIETGLLAALAARNAQSVNTAITLAAHDSHGNLVGGLTGATSYGWMLIKTLWVADTHRRHGSATKLMHAAEAEGRALGCHGAWLDTSDTGAAAFYLSLGYTEFGRLENAPDRPPETHRRWFLRKSL